MASRYGWLRRNFHSKIKRLFLRIRVNVLYHPKRTILSLIAVIFTIYILYEIFSTPLSSHDHYDYNMEKFINTNKCQTMTPLALKVFEVFINRIMNTFDMLEVTYFLCYDTLWSTLNRANKKSFKLRISDACFNLCVLNEDISKHDESLIVRRFLNNGITVQYVHSDGIYILKPTTHLTGMNIYDMDKSHSHNPEDLHPILFLLHARVHVFEKDSQLDMYRRIGWKSRILPNIMCKQLHCFPTNLVDGRSTLPKIEFLPKLQIFVPHEGLEIQKYHYPDTWWTMTDTATTGSDDDDSNKDGDEKCL